MLLGSTVSYTIPAFAPPAASLAVVPTQRVLLAHTPTPIQAVRFPGLPESCPVVFVKRDDCTGAVEMSGNKTRKLEFLLAEARAQGCDCVITAGGTQSNHCRCTVACARVVGLDTQLVLREDFQQDGGNFFLDELMGAGIMHLDRATYTAGGGFDKFIAQAKAELEAKGRKPYVIPVGGSNPLGTWAYVDMFNEFVSSQMDAVERQAGGAPFTDIVCTAGSGSTLAGLAIASKWYNDSEAHGKKRGVPLRVRGYNVCDTPDWFYDQTNTLAAGIYGVKKQQDGGNSNSKDAADLLPIGDARNWVDIRCARGLGYSKASTAELQFLNDVARHTGMLFDRSYTNKTAYQMVRDLASGEFKPQGKLLFVHTGGGPSAFDQHEKIIGMQGFEVDPASPWGAPKGYQPWKRGSAAAGSPGSPATPPASPAGGFEAKSG